MIISSSSAEECAVFGAGAEPSGVCSSGATGDSTGTDCASASRSSSVAVIAAGELYEAATCSERSSAVKIPSAARLS
ncbi:unannotated protein [freshwater metagenome]|uniref:Unannotated protein n=1 Tax=freshwater metagenome TaxID=449393 RepID=A0A6J7JVZ0_9ZZZZ